MRPIELTGQRFSRLVVVSRGENDQFGKARWLCRCNCGNTITTRSNTLRKGETRSCGCLHLETVRSARTHGGRRTSLYRVWCVMRARCENPHSPAWHNYGGRGITVCKRWRDFAAFRADMGPKPTPQHTVERINNDGPYSPKNCRWATRREQALNTRRTKRFTHEGLALTLGEWSERTGLPESLLYFRINHSHWPIAEALTIPSQRKKPW
jgi:hypothetical protein